VLLLRPFPFFPFFYKGRRVLIATGLCVLFVVPTIWSAIPVFEDRNDAFPYAGPTVKIVPLEVEFLQVEQEIVPDKALISYLLKHQGKERYLAAISDAPMAAPLILSTGKAVMALGGYTGADAIIHMAQLKQFIASGVVRYFVFPQTIREANIPPAFREYQMNYQVLLKEAGLGSGETDAITIWVRTHCALVPQSVWHPPSSTNGRTAPPKDVTLLDVFDCA
jgi:4-amino-4-deoxy-L-arabinose transferase-like glycosyltransferase